MLYRQNVPRYIEVDASLSKGGVEKRPWLAAREPHSIYVLS